MGSFTPQVVDMDAYWYVVHCDLPKNTLVINDEQTSI